MKLDHSFWVFIFDLNLMSYLKYLQTWIQKVNTWDKLHKGLIRVQAPACQEITYKTNIMNVKEGKILKRIRNFNNKLLSLYYASQNNIICNRALFLHF